LKGKQNRDIVGARVVLESASGKQTRFVRGGGSFASTNDRRLVFGMGADAAITKVTVHWPWGGSQEFSNLAPDAYWRIVEGTAKAEKAYAKP
jgi:enediyne biosynthesis protein E4